MCLNSTCFCDQGNLDNLKFTGKTGTSCDYTYRQFFEQGFSFKQVYGWLLGAMGGTAVLTITILLIIAVA